MFLPFIYFSIEINKRIGIKIVTIGWLLIIKTENNGKETRFTFDKLVKSE